MLLKPCSQIPLHCVPTERKRKFSLMFAVFTLIIFAFAWCEKALNVDLWCEQHNRKVLNLFYGVFPLIDPDSYSDSDSNG